MRGCGRQASLSRNYLRVDSNPERLKKAADFGGTKTIDLSPVHTDNRGVDVAIEALGRQETFEITQSTPPGWHPVQSRRVFRQAHNSIESFAAGLGDRKIVTTLCPGGKERMRRLMELVAHHWVDLTPLLTHRFMLDDIEIAYDLFSHQRDGVLKVAIQSLTRRRCVTRPLKMLLTL